MSMASDPLSPYGAVGGLWTDSMGFQLGSVHNSAICQGRPCPIHHPSNGRTLFWPQHFQGGIMLRRCPHGFWHLDPDDPAGTHAYNDGCIWMYPEHGKHQSGLRSADTNSPQSCDGCCRRARADTNEVGNSLLHNYHRQGLSLEAHLYLEKPNQSSTRDHLAVFSDLNSGELAYLLHNVRSGYEPFHSEPARPGWYKSTGLSTWSSRATTIDCLEDATDLLGIIEEFRSSGAPMHGAELGLIRQLKDICGDRGVTEQMPESIRHKVKERYGI